jgi:hypothetical protein
MSKPPRPTPSTLLRRSLGAPWPPPAPERSPGSASEASLTRPPSLVRLLVELGEIGGANRGHLHTHTAAQSHRRSRESQGQAGCMGACSACARWVGMMDGWSRESRRCCSTCTCCPPAGRTDSTAAIKSTNPKKVECTSKVSQMVAAILREETRPRCTQRLRSACRASPRPPRGCCTPWKQLLRRAGARLSDKVAVRSLFTVHWRPHADGGAGRTSAASQPSRRSGGSHHAARGEAARGGLGAGGWSQG